jgi:hypothetical protein
MFRKIFDIVYHVLTFCILIGLVLLNLLNLNTPFKPIPSPYINTQCEPNTQVTIDFGTGVVTCLKKVQK